MRLRSTSLGLSQHLKGFTWLEVMVVVGFLTLLATLALPTSKRGFGSAGLSSQVSEISGLFEAARSQAVKMNRNTCVQLRSYRADSGEYKGQCVVEVYFVYPKGPTYTVKDCMEDDFNSSDYMLGYKLYPDLHMSYENEFPSDAGCSSTEWRNFLFLAGNGFLSQKKFRNQSMFSSIRDGRIVFKNPDDPQAQTWTMRVERSGVVSVE